MTLPNAILFDLDDTLLVAFGPAQSQWQRTIAAFADRLGPLEAGIVAQAIHTASADLWADPGRHKYWRHRIDEARRKIVVDAFAALAALGHTPPPRAVGDAMADAYNALHDDELAMFPDAHDTLDRLKQLGVKLALITNGAGPPQRAKVVRFALEHRFDHIQIEGEHGFGKPEERAYTHAMAALGVAPHETWMVGDNLEWEVVGPQRLGIHAIWHDGYGVGLPPGCPIKPDRIIRRLRELLP
ncbi:MAG: HAD family hydrolase [Alphaproteobacteria bacterium]|nr:HAD family hydrolase [Alphaproteobacteria bacterium]